MQSVGAEISSQGTSWGVQVGGWRSGSSCCVNTFGFDGNVGALIAFDKALSDYEVNLVNRCMMQTWGALPNYKAIGLWLDAYSPDDLYTDAACTTNVDFTGASGAQSVLCWRDKSDNDHEVINAVTANAPIYDTTVTQNGATVLTFDGVNDYLSVASASSFDEIDSMAIFAVFAADDVTNGTGGVQTILGKENASTDQQYALEIATAEDGEISFYLDNNTKGSDNINTSADVLEDETYALVSISLGVRSALVIPTEMYVNGTRTHSTATLDSATVADALNIGRSSLSSGSQYFGGKIAEIIIYNESVNSSQRLLIESYLMNKWGIPPP